MEVVPGRGLRGVLGLEARVKAISYCTPRYGGEAKRLEESLRLFGMDFVIRELPDRGSWAMNARAKIAVLIWARLQWPGLALLWLDADAEVMAPPVLPFTPHEVDVGCHWHERSDGKASPGTVYLGPTMASYHFLLAWIEGCSGSLNDQDTFNAALEVIPEDRVWHMPAEWCYIEDLDLPPSITGKEVVIQQHQASRRLRRRNT